MDVEHRQLVQLLPLLPLLAELGRTEHITETAELLGLPQSTVSRAIARASAIVGTELLIRDGRGVRLTPAAKALMPHIEAALAEFQTGLDSVRHESEVVRGRIAVSFQHTFGEAMLPLLISAFRSRHPQTAFDLSQGARDGCLAELAAGSADVALTAPVATPSKRIGSAALYREPLRLVVHHRHALAGRRQGQGCRDPAGALRGDGVRLRHALADRRVVPRGGVPPAHCLREPGLAHRPRPRLGRARRQHPAARRLRTRQSRTKQPPPVAGHRSRRRRARAGWRFPWIQTWRSARSASRGGSRFRGMPWPMPSPIPCACSANSCSATVRRSWQASCANARQAEPGRRPCSWCARGRRLAPRSP